VAKTASASLESALEAAGVTDGESGVLASFMLWKPIAKSALHVVEMADHVLFRHFSFCVIFPLNGYLSDRS
jgi:hypothetical protein